jgi:uncharacterized protein YrrD
LLIKSHGKKPGALRSETPPNLEVLSTEGKKIGWMTDALVDESDGRVRAVEISYGYFDDFTRGRQWLQDFALRPCGVIAVLRESGAENPG